MAEDEAVKSVVRAMAILRSFSLAEPELGVSEVARRLNVHKSTVSRLLATLEAGGLVSRNPESGRYRLGVGLIELAGLVLLHVDVRQLARPLMAELAQQTEETVNLAVRDGDAAINVEHAAASGHRVRDIGRVGRRTSLHASATGKVLLAAVPEPELTALLPTPLAAYTPHTITDVHQLHAELTQVRAQGYAAGLEELEIGLNAVAAPVRDHAGQVVAAVSVAGPAYRFSRQRAVGETAAQVVICAALISRALGYRGMTDDK